jgi:hypothetical protein
VIKITLSKQREVMFTSLAQNFQFHAQIVKMLDLDLFSHFVDHS